MTTVIALTRGFSALIDDVDADRVLRFKWSANVHKRKDGSTRVYARRGYSERGIFKQEFLHRFILNAGNGEIVDHADGNTLNNCRANLRIASASQNASNRLAQSASGLPRGVKADRRYGYFEAVIRVERRRIFLGCFQSPDEAAAAYDEAARKFHGPFGVTNAEGRSAASEPQAETHPQDSRTT